MRCLLVHCIGETAEEDTCKPEIRDVRRAEGSRQHSIESDILLQHFVVVPRGRAQACLSHPRAILYRH